MQTFVDFADLLAATALLAALLDSTGRGVRQLDRLARRQGRHAGSRLGHRTPVLFRGFARLTQSRCPLRGSRRSRGRPTRPCSRRHPCDQKDGMATTVVGFGIARLFARRRLGDHRLPVRRKSLPVHCRCRHGQTRCNREFDVIVGAAAHRSVREPRSAGRLLLFLLHARRCPGQADHGRYRCTRRRWRACCSGRRRVAGARRAALAKGRAGIAFVQKRHSGACRAAALRQSRYRSRLCGGHCQTRLADRDRVVE